MQDVQNAAYDAAACDADYDVRSAFDKNRRLGGVYIPEF